MATKTVTVPDVGPVQLYKRKGIRSLRLSIGHDGTIRVSLPHWVPYSAGAEFARSKRDWIKSKQVLVEPLRDGGRIGKAHRLNFIAESGRTSMATRITNSGEIRVYHPIYMETEDSVVQKAAEKASIRALRLQAEKLLPQRLESLANQHGFSYGDVSIKHLRSRWGSCTEQKDIALSCYLMQLPWYLIDYVILHELMHTKVMAHGKTFWDELGNYVPNLKQYRKEIRQYKPVLITG